MSNIKTNPYRAPFDKFFVDYKNGSTVKDICLEGMTANNLTEDEASYILSYTARSSSWINRDLRKGDVLSSKEKLDFALMLNNSLKKMPTFENSIVYRMDSPSENFNTKGIVGEWFKTKIGFTFRIPYFLSTSKDNWGETSYIWEIETLKEGSYGKDISNLTNNVGENEVLFQQNACFRIERVEGNLIGLSEIKPTEQVDFELTGLYHLNIK